MSLTMEVDSTPLATYKSQAAPAAKPVKKTRAAAIPAARLNATSEGYLRLVVVLNYVVLTASFTISFATLADFGMKSGLGWKSYLVPLSMDALSLAITISLPALKGMGEKTFRYLATLWGVACLVAALNISAVLVPAFSRSWTYDDFAAAVIVGFAPFGGIITTHLVLALKLAKTSTSAKALAARQAAIDAGAPVLTAATPPVSTSPVDAPAATTKATTRLTDETRSEIASLFTTQTLSIPEIAKRVGTSAPTARKVLKDAGLYEGKEAS